jgi:uncharacterized protein
MHFSQIISSRTNIPEHKVGNTIKLLEEGATIPFIARYRKEAIGSIDEIAIISIQQELKKLKELEKRKETVLGTIEEQGKLTEELKKRIQLCSDASDLEDIYLPFKPKRKTKASIAREKGLEPLANELLEQKCQQPVVMAKKYLSDEVPNAEDALQGARDIIAELVSENEHSRQRVRHIFQQKALIHSKVVRGKENEAAKYKDFFEFSELLKSCPSHRYLAIRRGESEGFLRVSIAPEAEEVLERLEQLFLKGNGETTQQIKSAIHDSYERLLAPSIETEIRNSSKAIADAEAIKVFADNLRQLLLSPPLGPRRVLGIDPGFRTGCKVVALNENGDLLNYTTIFIHPPQADEILSRKTLERLVAQYEIEAIGIGNGTAGRETMDFCKKLDFSRQVETFSVNEAGASIYSASEIAREEFPGHDITVRGAASIGRRLMDPLAELVKIDPKSIGVGQYQHDVNQVQLKESLDRTVESCVNAVGVNLNTASKHLLTYISGLGPVLAQNIVRFRSESGKFDNREQLKKVPRMGAKAFEQCAGFLRIPGGSYPLDNTAVHPESYNVVAEMAKSVGVSIGQLIRDATLQKQIDLKKFVSEKTGMPTLIDIMKELEKPGLDPRGSAKVFEYGNVRSIDDLIQGMILPGIVTNITNFGAFVDIGVKQDGLVHISQLAAKFVKQPSEVVKLHQEVTVRVVEIDLARKRIHLSMKDV